MLLNCGADPNVKNKNGWSALHSAAYNKHLHVSKILLEGGANPNLKDSKGRLFLTADERRTNSQGHCQKQGSKTNSGTHGETAGEGCAASGSIASSCSAVRRMVG
jgi:hypothetical protein